MRMKSNLRTYLLFALSLAAFVLTFHFYGHPVQPGLDPSWKYAVNRSFTDGLRFGRDVIVSYGPFGFLTDPLPLGSNLAIAFWFEVVVRLSFVLLFVFLFLGDPPERTRDRIFPAAFLLLLLFTINRGEKTPGMELVALAAGLVFTAYRRNSAALLAAAAALSAFALLVKFSSGVLCFTFIGVYALWVLILQRKVIRPAVWICSPFLLAAAIWLFFYGSFEGLGDYVSGSLEQSRGYSSAMTSLGAPDAPGWVAAAIGTLIFLAVSLRKERGLLLCFLLFCPGLLASVKYGVTKQPQFLFSYAFLMLFVLAGQAGTLRRQASIAATMSLSIVFLNLATGFLGADVFRFDSSEPMLKPPDLRTSFSQMVDFKGYENSLARESEALLQPVRLSDSTRLLIGNKPVDTYPWEISFIPANGLNWRPRPAFQSYFAYTPWFDRKNEAFFRSGRAPRYLLWEFARGDSLLSIDNRYLLNDEPMTIVQILGNYSLVAVDGEALVFSRRGKPAFSPPLPAFGTGPIPWNDWFHIPFDERGITRARVLFSRTLLGKVRRAVYKESPVFVDYLFESGEMIHCRLVLDNAVSGVWGNPFVVSLLRPNEARKAVAMRIVNPDADQGSFDPQFTVQWEFIPFNVRPEPFLVTAAQARDGS